MFPFENFISNIGERNPIPARMDHAQGKIFISYVYRGNCYLQVGRYHKVQFGPLWLDREAIPLNGSFTTPTAYVHWRHNNLHALLNTPGVEVTPIKG